MADNIKDNTPCNLYLRLVQAAIALAMICVCSALIYAHFTLRDIDRGWDQLGALTTEKEQTLDELLEAHGEHSDTVNSQELAKTASIIEHTKELRQKRAKLAARKTADIDRLDRNILRR